jgi:hypothetical protein
VRGAAATVLGIALFAGLLVYMTLREGGPSCEVCMAFEGRTACMTVTAPTQDEAVAQARNNACGILTQGMAAELACQRMPPASVSCEH